MNFINFTGRIHLINSDQKLATVAPQISSAEVLGFDTETRPSFLKGQVFKVALLQFATAHDAYLIRLHHITQFQGIIDIFENDKIIKVGAAIRDDLNLLQKLFKFKPSRFIELQDLAKSKGLKNFGLKSMTEEILQGTISKGPKMTNWEDPVLTDRQLMYAATDAWIGLMLYQKLAHG
jgi:ribonuclease D